MLLTAPSRNTSAHHPAFERHLLLLKVQSALSPMVLDFFSLCTLTPFNRPTRTYHGATTHAVGTRTGAGLPLRAAEVPQRGPALDPDTLLHVSGEDAPTGTAVDGLVVDQEQHVSLAPVWIRPFFAGAFRVFFFRGSGGCRRRVAAVAPLFPEQ